MVSRTAGLTRAHLSSGTETGFVSTLDLSGCDRLRREARMADTKIATSGAELYERDFFQWTREQAAALRSAGAGRNAQLDYEKLAEEIESLGNRDRRELGSRIATIIEHLLKLQFSPATAPRAGWMSTVTRERREIATILADSPSLRRRVAELLPDESAGAERLVARELANRGETAASALIRLIDPANRYGEAEVLDDWWPEPETKV
jgi:hypothetical protein